ncbi:hypothetical protein M378DRAFT_164763 [Amanita muscaria Koide BX008]|uniref:Uncharacterized protein n=1 Tax=Amanita muscaria (strain Koide BX008) TaxID=946122 RepID=A0A0C2X3F2_AMAMK|nr:hypothetical protein M378DRAFT_164763 [Amanita muscaria Koide BX008]
MGHKHQDALTRSPVVAQWAHWHELDLDTGNSWVDICRVVAAVKDPRFSAKFISAPSADEIELRCAIKYPSLEARSLMSSLVFRSQTRRSHDGKPFVPTAGSDW